MQMLEQVMEENDQFFSLADLGEMQFVYNSIRSLEVMGVRPEEFHPGHFQDAMHPDDFERFGLARALVYRIEHAIFIPKKGSKVLSTNFMVKNPAVPVVMNVGFVIPGTNTDRQSTYSERSL